MKYVLLVILALGVATGSSRAAHVDYFLRLDGIDGESTDTRQTNNIEIISFNWGISQTSATNSPNGGGGGAGKAVFQDMHFVAKVSKASPKLMLFCASGKHLDSVDLFAYRSSDSSQPYLKIKLQDVLITSYQVSASGGDIGSTDGPIPTDQISVNYTKISYTYVAFDGSETFGEAIRPAITQ